MRTRITIEHESVASLRSSRLWNEAVALFAKGGEVSVVEITESDAETDDHASDCAIYNGPAAPAGECDCKS